MEKKEQSRATKVLKSGFNRAREGLNSLDMFGMTVDFKINGKDKVTSLLGAVVSMLVMLLSLSFAYYKVDILISRNDTNYSSIVNSGALEQNFKFGQSDGF